MRRALLVLLAFASVTSSAHAVELAECDKHGCRPAAGVTFYDGHPQVIDEKAVFSAGGYTLTCRGTEPIGQITGGLSITRHLRFWRCTDPAGDCGETVTESVDGLLSEPQPGYVQVSSEAHFTFVCPDGLVTIEGPFSGLFGAREAGGAAPVTNDPGTKAYLHDDPALAPQELVGSRDGTPLGPVTLVVMEEMRFGPEYPGSANKHIEFLGPQLAASAMHDQQAERANDVDEDGDDS